MKQLPLHYNIRSITARKTRTVLTIIGIAVVVFIAVMMSALSRGLIASAESTGSALNILVLSRGADSVEFSAINPADEQRLRHSHGVVAASPEVSINTIVSLPEFESASSRDQRIVIRGVGPAGPDVHQQIQLVEGRWPSRGNELAVGSLAYAKLRVPRNAVSIGRAVEFEGQSWSIVGTFEAPGTVYESEAWTHVDDLRAASRRDDYSVIVLRAEDEAAADELLFDLAMRTDVIVTAMRETDYYAEHAESLRPIQGVTFATSVILMLGGLLAGMNTMFNSILARVREMGVLLVLGYRRSSILFSFMLESILLSMVAGTIGVACGFLLNGLPMTIPMAAFRFIVDPVTIAIGLGFALVIGILSVIIPLMRVARLSTAESLRHV